MKVLIFALVMFSFTNPTRAKDKLPFSATPTSQLGSKMVDVNLLKLQAEEVAKAGKENKEITSGLQKQNHELLNDLAQFAEKLKLENPNIQSINKAKAERILKAMRNHPVVGVKALSKYDTWDNMIGYCFGRAAYVHWELLRQQIPSHVIGKIFAVGDLRLNKSSFKWDYHVATTVLSENFEWLMIDPLVEKVLPVKEWMDDVLQFSFEPSHPRIRFYFTDAVKLHAIPGAYSMEKLMFEEYKGYFRDLFKWFQNNPPKKMKNTKL
ncbi:MAG: hypothetical protein A4S09_05330 [Proteobacteria bacterium SG_bin7]|nr:MAG: hypothetical protein A4S09_05330 [Proteobacteria bacterium SG_bin7]